MKQLNNLCVLKYLLLKFTLNLIEFNGLFFMRIKFNYSYLFYPLEKLSLFKCSKQQLHFAEPKNTNIRTIFKFKSIKLEVKSTCH